LIKVLTTMLHDCCATVCHIYG